MRDLRILQLTEEKKRFANDRNVRRKTLSVDYSSVVSRDSIQKTRCGRTAISESFLQRQILKLEKQIRVLYGKKYYASQVFVTVSHAFVAMYSLVLFLLLPLSFANGS